MRIGIDISQIVHEGTGVALYVRNLVPLLAARHPEHEYVLFGTSLRKRQVLKDFGKMFQNNARVRLIILPIPPSLLDVLWNRLHIIPVEWFTGPIDVFWSSDWTQPPLARAAGVTTIHDLAVLHYPKESFGTIVATQIRRLRHAQKECRMFLCDSEATKQDAHTLLGIGEDQLKVVYPGFHTI